MRNQTLRDRLDQLTDRGHELLLSFADLILADPQYRRDRASAPPALRLITTTHRKDSVTRPTGAYFRRQHGKMIEVSPELARMCDTTPDQLLGEGWRRFVPAEDIATVDARWKAARDRKVPFSALIRIHTATGRIIYAYQRVRPWVNRQTGEFEGFFGTLHDQVLPMGAKQQEQTG